MLMLSFDFMVRKEKQHFWPNALFENLSFGTEAFILLCVPLPHTECNRKFYQVNFDLKFLFLLEKELKQICYSKNKCLYQHNETIERIRHSLGRIISQWLQWESLSWQHIILIQKKGTGGLCRSTSSGQNHRNVFIHLNNGVSYKKLSQSLVKELFNRQQKIWTSGTLCCTIKECNLALLKNELIQMLILVYFVASSILYFYCL